MNRLNIPTRLFLFFFFLAIFFFPTIFCGLDNSKAYGEIIDGYPSREERFIVHHHNVARMNCTQSRLAGYVASPQSLCDETSSTHPLWISIDLSRAARSQCADLANNCGGLQHPSCDGTSPSARVAKFFSCGWSGENGALGYGYTSVSDSGWFCEGSTYSCTSGGHRSSSFSSGNYMVGVGVYKSYIFADFSSCKKIFTETDHPIYSGLYESKRFMMLYYDSRVEDDEEVNGYVIINGFTYQMQRDFGNPGSAHFVLKYNSSTSSWNPTCAEYYFKVVSPSGTFFLPQTGSFINSITGSDCIILGQSDPSYIARQLTPLMIVATILVSIISPISILVFLIIIIIIVLLLSFLKFQKNKESKKQKKDSKKEKKKKQKTSFKK